MNKLIIFIALYVCPGLWSMVWKTKFLSYLHLSGSWLLHFHTLILLREWAVYLIPLHWRQGAHALNEITDPPPLSRFKLKTVLPWPFHSSNHFSVGCLHSTLWEQDRSIVNLLTLRQMNNLRTPRTQCILIFYSEI